MSTNEPINTIPVQQFIQLVKTAENTRQREIKMPIDQAKNLAFTLGIVMARMNGDLEKFVRDFAMAKEQEQITVNLDGGTSWS